MFGVRHHMRDVESIERQLLEVFPSRVVTGVIAPHECEECAALCECLSQSGWEGISDSFVEQYSGSLPLLSPEAYNAYLPAWLRASVRIPDGDVAAMLLINLADDPPMEYFTGAQAVAILEVARFVVHSSIWGTDDPGNVESLSAVERVWVAARA
jgi:hypothetical protein